MIDQKKKIQCPIILNICVNFKLLVAGSKVALATCCKQ